MAEEKMTREDMIKELKKFIRVQEYESLVLSFIPKLNNNKVKEAYYKHFQITCKRQGEILKN